MHIFSGKNMLPPKLTELLWLCYTLTCCGATNCFLGSRWLFRIRHTTAPLEATHTRSSSTSVIALLDAIHNARLTWWQTCKPSIRYSYFNNRVIRVWNNLPKDVDFTSYGGFKQSSGVIVSAYRYIAITTLAIIAVFLVHLRQFLIYLHQIYRHSSVPKKHVSLHFSSFLAQAVSEDGAAEFFCHVVSVTV